AMAKVVGEFAVKTGQQEAEKTLRRARGQAEGVLSTLRSPSRPGPSAAPRATAPPSRPVPTAEPAPEPAARVSAPPAPEPVSPPPSVDSLAIHGYDTLSASQVVQRL